MGRIKTIMVYRGDLEVMINERDLDIWEKGGWSKSKPVKRTRKKAVEKEPVEEFKLEDSSEE